ncbi:hypothetical protein RFI_07861 [Reticulomyxa filosa]|uniref:Uncharacterized protein n=1 Tax=Reticulomyxa filosa TaxID=46433 RepID=X6NSJ2_RETFI|nr:hypothetical protein RFI_07861 [Reticulomyxa filosa]|eukprot:ETO29265.1 hypothetical protein RFI_07861 [Reticulomyxa filosa]
MRVDGVKAKETKHLNMTTLFETLAPLPVRLEHTQCMLHKDEILICGGYGEKDQYKFICSYPKNIWLDGHCVVRRVNNNRNETILLSFGGRHKHTLTMQYVSVWDDDDNKNKDKAKSGSTKVYNQWIPFTDNDNKPIALDRDEKGYFGTRAVIGGSRNHLLFITYYPYFIDVFDFDKLEFVKFGVLPTDNTKIRYHCFVARTGNALSTAEKINKVYEMILFCESAGLSIKYDEEKNTFQIRNFPVCTPIRPFHSYGYAYIDDFILLFGGSAYCLRDISNEIYKHAITEVKWMKYEQTLPTVLADCTAILDADKTYLHIFSGLDDRTFTTNTHRRINVNGWIKAETEIEKQWTAEEEEKIEIADIKIIVEGAKEDFDIKKLKVKIESFRKKDIEIVVDYWVRSVSLKLGWINDFNILISYKVNYNPEKIFQEIEGPSTIFHLC